MALEVRITRGRCLGLSLYPRFFHRDPNLHDRGEGQLGDFRAWKESVHLESNEGECNKFSTRRCDDDCA